MNMGFKKRVCVLTNLIIVMIINDHKSDANCKYHLHISIELKHFYYCFIYFMHIMHFK